MEIKHRGPPRCGAPVPADEQRAVGRIEHALRDACEAVVGWRYAGAVGEIHELALGDEGGDGHGAVDRRQNERELHHELSAAPVLVGPMHPLEEVPSKYRCPRER